MNDTSIFLSAPHTSRDRAKAVLLEVEAFEAMIGVSQRISEPSRGGRAVAPGVPPGAGRGRL
jgi:hypothetical protein